MTQQPNPSLLRERYLLRRRLGVGGMGTVYLAEDQNLAGKVVAVKQNTETAPEIQAQFNQEAVLLAHLKHPALPSVTDHFIESDGRQFLVMEYIEGKDLWELLQENGGALPEATVLGWIVTVMDALNYLHRHVDPATKQPRPIIHRDVKPANIKLKTDGQIYLVDFGLAKVEESGRTHPGARAFTPGYSPFEQYGGGTTTRSDIYALGATLYALLTGVVPPEAPMLVSGDALTAPCQLNPRITPNTEGVILQAMALRPEERFQTIAEMRSALFRKPAPPTQRVREQDNATTAHLPVERPAQRRRQGCAWLMVAIVMVIGLAVTAFTINRALGDDAARLLVSLFRPTATPTVASPTATATTTPLPVVVAPSATPTAPPVPTATDTPIPTLTSTQPPTPSPTAMPTTAPSSTPTFTPTFMPTHTPTSTRSATGTATPAEPNASVPPATATPCPTGMAEIDQGAHAFCLDTHEVTNAEYQECDRLGIEDCIISEEQKTDMPLYNGSSTYYADPQYAAYPVVNITVAQAQSYCTEYGAYRYGLPLRLPTFDEWAVAYAQTTAAQAPVGRLLPAMDLQLSLTDNTIHGVVDNVKEWVVIELTPAGDIEQAMAAGGSFEGEAFPTTRAELGNYERVSGSAVNTRRDYTVGFRCAVDRDGPH